MKKVFGEGFWKSSSDFSKKYGIKSARYCYWKEELINASNDIFGQKGR